LGKELNKLRTSLGYANLSGWCSSLVRILTIAPERWLSLSSITVVIKQFSSGYVAPKFCKLRHSKCQELREILQQYNIRARQYTNFKDNAIFYIMTLPTT